MQHWSRQAPPTAPTAAHYGMGFRAGIVFTTLLRRPRPPGAGTAHAMIICAGRKACGPHRTPQKASFHAAEGRAVPSRGERGERCKQMQVAWKYLSAPRHCASRPYCCRVDLFTQLWGMVGKALAQACCCCCVSIPAPARATVPYNGDLPYLPCPHLTFIFASSLV